jgi:hypothetical protein
MAVYTSIDDIAAFFVGTSFSSTTSPSTHQIDRWIVEAGAWIDNSLIKRYTLPLTNTTDLTILQSIANEYVLSRIEFILGRNRTNVTNKKAVIPRRPDDSEFFAKLKMIECGDITLQSTRSAVSSYSYNAENDIVAFTTKDTDQW